MEVSESVGLIEVEITASRNTSTVAELHLSTKDGSALSKSSHISLVLMH